MPVEPPRGEVPMPGTTSEKTLSEMHFEFQLYGNIINKKVKHSFMFSRKYSQAISRVCSVLLLKLYIYLYITCGCTLSHLLAFRILENHLT